jgi:hypothetical protein
MNDNDILYANDAKASEADGRLLVRFTLESRLDRRRTAEEGRSVYRDVPFVTIHIPGDKTLGIHRPVNASDKRRFPIQWARFENAQRTNMTPEMVGTPLSAWAMITPAQRNELQYFNVMTVEQLAGMSDDGAGSMMGIQKLKALAKRHVELERDNAPMVKLERELETRDNEISALKDQMKAQAETLDKLIANLASPKGKKE